MLTHEWILSLSMGCLLLFWFLFLITGRDVLGLRGWGVEVRGQLYGVHALQPL